VREDDRSDGLGVVVVGLRAGVGEFADVLHESNVGGEAKGVVEGSVHSGKDSLHK